MAIVHDVMPVFELFQPTTVDDTLALLDTYGADAWVLAGGLDTFDWFKDRNKRRKVVVDLSGVQTLRGVKKTADGGLEIGASTTLTDVASEPLVKQNYRLLSQAAALVASPQIRRTRAAGTTARDGPAIAPAATSATRTRRPQSIASTPSSMRIAASR
jgi:xanthine dehydrogenase YagS FAD-binding subunit